MKCPRCWAEKAYIRQVKGWKGVFLALLLLEPMKCHHCYHKFVVPWFSTFGKQTKPPKPRLSSATQMAGPSYAAQCEAAKRATEVDTVGYGDLAPRRERQEVDTLRADAA